MQHSGVNPWLIGIDEAGRGPLAGPVVAGAVLWMSDMPMVQGVRDSKLLTESKRAALFPLICQRAVAYGIGFASAQEIDSLNILKATWLAMERAYAHLIALTQTKGMSSAGIPVWIDGRDIPKTIPCSRGVIQGDRLVPVISAASILAQHTRDQWMLEAAKQYPLYNFAQHKGYPTAAHRREVWQHGPCPIHRRSFRHGD